MPLFRSSTPGSGTVTALVELSCKYDCNEWRNIVDNTLTGAIPADEATSRATETANPGTAKTAKWTFLGSATALLVALGAVLEQGAGLSEALTGFIDEISPPASEWTEDEAVVIEPDESIARLTIQICDSESKSGESMHIAFLLGQNRATLPPAFVLKKKGCRGEKGRVWMNPDDFEKYISQPLKADFKLSYSRSHLHSLDQLISSALNLCHPAAAVNNSPEGN
jgi:hypothetical protein